ncbi:hypothetical protein E3N88_38741 [Mikania micrantha]|uniref:Reverse transcriptase domain-containing protein n=1 Tax=Mikania micrantha TaxID=192012 RepID=A0A5N6LUU5_9ASTR|nr:hypothetical protein E3N88_38741 [Mikania micrantha]
MHKCYSGVHDVFHVSNLNRCLADESLIIPLEEIQIDEQLHFIVEPVEIMEREVKRLKRSRIHIVKVRWNSKRGPEFTWSTKRSPLRVVDLFFSSTRRVLPCQASDIGTGKGRTHEDGDGNDKPGRLVRQRDRKSRFMHEENDNRGLL